MQKLFFGLCFLLSSVASFANHTKGGWMYYETIGPGSAPNTIQYRVVLKMYTECILNPGQEDGAATFTFFNAANGQVFANISAPLTSDITINNCTTPECHPCISNIPSICYRIRTFEIFIDLPVTRGGFIVANQRCCRIINIVNLQPPSNDLGETWTVSIPGDLNPGAQLNNSAKFAQNDTAIICQDSPFEFDFSAIDVDGDSLVYEFTSAYNGGSTGNANPPQSNPPPFANIPYSIGYSGTSPLGPGVTINRTTGIVTGIAPRVGTYVITVVVSEYKRNTTIKIAEVRKSLHIRSEDCSLTSAVLDPEYVFCDDFVVSFQNGGPNTNIQTYFWDFGDGNTSTDPAPTHPYAAAGDYILKLVVNRGLPCSDSATAIVKLYPGFFPDFKVEGQCKNTPIKFTDLTTAAFGTVNFWQWNFGDPASGTLNTANTNPAFHNYANTGDYDVTFIVKSSKGCTDTLYKKIPITDKPALQLSNDTTICNIDTLQLFAVGDGSVLWSPNYMINDVTSHTPLVSPDVTTTYHVQLTDPFGCTGGDTVRVNVVNRVTQFAPADTTICLGDAITLQLVSDALYYTWTPDDGSINNTSIRNPVVRPLVPTTYHVVGSIGKCNAENDIQVKPVPYPEANAGPDQSICLGGSAQLQASGGTIYSWSPRAFLTATNIPNPMSIKPTSSVRYVVTVRDTKGCPKPASDTMILQVVNIIADAGPRDTSLVIGQPLQLGATGSTNYLWTPSTWLDNPNIHNPIALPQDNIEYVVRVSNDIGCFDTDSIRVRIYRVKPDLFVPNAFSPNGDGLNDVFRPIPIGMKSLDVFRVFNRWGQMVYSGTDAKLGWDGTFGGRGQDAGTYVWYAEGVDYQNNTIKRKGYVVLVR